MRAVEIVEVLPLPKLGSEQPCVVEHDVIEAPVELVGIDPM
jgi:hypothetical protein